MLKNFGKRKGAPITIFFRNVFHLVLQKKLLGEPFCILKNSWYQNSSRIRGAGRLSPLPVERFPSQNTEKVRRGHILCFKIFQESKVLMDQRGYFGGGVKFPRFSVGTVLSHSSEGFLRGTFLWFTNILVWNNYMDKRFITIFVQIVLSHSSEGFRRGTFLCFRNLLVWKDFVDKRVVSRLSVEIVLSPSTQTICRGTILCFRLFPVSNTFKDKRGRGAYPKIVSYMFCLTLPKRFVAEDICNSQNICFREMFGIRKGAAYHDWPSSKFFVSLYGKIPLEKPSEISKKLRYRKH